MNSAGVPFGRIGQLGGSILLGIILLVPVSAQRESGTDLEGQVVDATGAVIAGAEITVTESMTGVIHTTRTDRAGAYRLAGLPPGLISVRAGFDGFKAVEVTHIEIRGQQTLRRNFRLEPGTIVEIIDVRDGRDSLLEPKAEMTIVLTDDGSNDTPLNGRNPLDLIMLLSGTQAPPFETLDLGDPATRDPVVNAPEDAGLLSLNGGRAESNNITVDGFDNNDDRLGRERSSLSLEAIAEVKVNTNRFSAEQGRGSGGQIRFRTRSGTNRFHGSGFYGFQDESLNANSFFRNARGLSRLPFQRREIGGRVSGPLHRNRAFFFVAYERQDEPDLDSIVALVPSDPHLNPLYPIDSGPAGRPFLRDGVLVALFEDDVQASGRRHSWFSRIDYRPGSRHTLFFHTDIARSSRVRSRETGATLPSSILVRQRSSTAVSVQHRWKAGNHLVVMGRFQHSILSPQNAQADLRPGVIVGSSRGLDFGTYGEWANGFRAGAGTFPETYRENRVQWAQTLDWHRGSHRIACGGDVIHLRAATIQAHLFHGFYNFPNFGEFAANTPSRFRQRTGDPRRLVHNTVTGIFIQDEWRWRPHLAVTFGVRVDGETALAPARLHTGPRLAVAWDPSRTGFIVLRGGFGLFFDRLRLKRFDDYSVRSDIFEIDLGDGAGSTGPIEAVDRIGGFPHIFPNDPGHGALTGVLRPLTDTRRLSSDLRLPVSLQAELSVERAITKTWRVEVSYRFNRTQYLWRGQNVNAPRPPPGGFSDFLLNPPIGYAGVVILPDGRAAFDNRARQIADVSLGYARFDLSDVRYKDQGRGATGIRTFGLNAMPSSSATTNPVLAALNAVRYLRPDPMLGEIEQLVSDGQAVYHGLSVHLSGRLGRDRHISLSYTLSKVIDDAALATHSPMDEFNARLDRSLGTTDTRHRFVLRGRFTAPPWLGKIEFTPLLSMMSGRPFNITTNGQDRNLSDTLTDRPNYQGADPIRFIRPGHTAASEHAASLFSFSAVGENGTLGRNSGQGPSNAWMNVRLSRTFRVAERWRVRPWIDVYNVLNKPNFLMNGFYGPLDERFDRSIFLQPRASRKPRIFELGIRLDF